MVASPSVSNNPFQHNLNEVHGQLQVVNDCLQTLRVFLAPGQITQLVALRVEEPGRSTPIDYAGFFDFDHLDLMAREAATFSGTAKGVHFTLNPLNPEVLNRCPNRVQPVRKGILARDRDILRRSWLMIDLDPVRPKGLSATDEEKLRALEVCNRVAAFLYGHGFPYQIRADSGNGYHLYYRVDLPADDKRPHEVLRILKREFDSDAVRIDTSVASASQLTKLFGTLSAKGASTVERPHRYSSLQFVANSVVVSEDILSQLTLPSREVCEESVPIAINQALLIDRARKYVERMPASVSGNHGHDRLFAVACCLVKGFDLSHAQALPLLREYNLRSVPPWPESELERKLNEASSRPDSRPVGYLLGQSSQSQATISVESPVVANADKYAAPLPGPAYPVSIPDFVPVPTAFVTDLLDPCFIDVGRGRPKFHCHQTLIWLGFYGLYEQRRSMIWIPDEMVASCVGGALPSKEWRSRVTKMDGSRRSTQESLRREVRRLLNEREEAIPVRRNLVEIDPDSQDSIGERNERLNSQINELNSQILPERCSAHCPMHASGVRHEHYILRPLEHYWGEMRDLCTTITGQHAEFDFNKKAEGQTTTVLDSLVRSNKVHHAYLPVQLFGQAAGLNIRQIRLVQGLMRERTRWKQVGVQRSMVPRMVLIRNASVLAVRGKARVPCPVLDPSQEYIAFGGNLKKLRGRGYRLFGEFDSNMQCQGGWLRRLGYPASSEMDENRIWKWIGILLKDLALLSQSFGLVAAAVDKRGQWRSLDQLRQMVKEGRSRTWLKTCSLRIFAPADYLIRWRRWFAERLGFSFIPGGEWSVSQNVVCQHAQAPTADSIRTQLKAAGIQSKQLAAQLNWTESRVCRQLNDKTRPAPELITAAQRLLDAGGRNRIA